MHWSQPEILLYDPDPNMRMSYPDLIEQDGRYWVTETQKTVARVHELDKTLLEGLWSQGSVKTVAREGLLGEFAPGKTKLPGTIDLGRDGGVSLDLWITLDKDSTGSRWSTRATPTAGGSYCRPPSTAPCGSSSSTAGRRRRGSAIPGLITAGKQHHVVAIVDAGPKIITFVVDGRLCDGGHARQYGWGRYEGELGDVTGSGEVTVARGREGAALSSLSADFRGDRQLPRRSALIRTFSFFDAVFGLRRGKTPKTVDFEIRDSGYVPMARPRRSKAWRWRSVGTSIGRNPHPVMTPNTLGCYIVSPGLSAGTGNYHGESVRGATLRSLRLAASERGLGHDRFSRLLGQLTLVIVE